MMGGSAAWGYGPEDLSSTGRPARKRVDRGATLGGRPEWVILGARNPDGTVTVFASTKLTSAELDFTRKSYDFESFTAMRAGFHPSVTMSIVMPTFVAIVAPNYQAALAGLFGQGDWNPDDQAPAAIEGKRFG